MRHVVIGVPARNEAANIGDLADRLDVGAALVGELATCELVLAYQSSDDATLEVWRSHRGRVSPQVVVCPPGLSGKGRNVKLLLQRAAESGSDLLLVDADLREYSERNIARFVTAAYDGGLDFVLPLWARPWGRANTTNYLAAPLLRAVFGARLRQPLAGHVFLSRRFVQSIDIEGLPDDYGIDIAITVVALAQGRAIGQVLVPDLHHDGRDANSGRIMFEVARTALALLATPPPRLRADVAWPERYWARLEWPEEDAPQADFAEILWQFQALETPEAEQWKRSLDGPSEPVTQAWCQALVDAVRQVRGGVDPDDAAAALVGPFFVHAEYWRNRPRPTIAEAEAYVAELGERSAALLA